MTAGVGATGAKGAATKGAAARAAAAYSVQQVLQYQRSLNQALPEAVTKFNLAAEDKGFAQAMAFGVLRELPSLEWFVAQLLDKPLKPKVRSVHYLILVGLYQLTAMRTAKHAAVSATVDATALLRQKALKGLVNAVLRAFQRQHETLQQQLKQLDDKTLNHPGWLLKRLQTAYPDQWHTIVHANQAQPPMWLRVNQRYLDAHQLSLADYQAQLASLNIHSERVVHMTMGQSGLSVGFSVGLDTGLNSALRLRQPTDVTALPGFAEGAVSVQDAAAQFAPTLLPVKSGDYVLDACAAPGGKTAHLLELADIEIDALDIDPIRLQRVTENLQRLQLQANVIQGDASKNDWWSGRSYDAILLDAPCSATGVIRRHPDIKWLRQNTDIAELVALQRQILDNLWVMLKPGGCLVYATCSVLPDENRLQIDDFVARHADARLDTIALPCTPAPAASATANDEQNDEQNNASQIYWHELVQLAPQGTGMQWLPHSDGHDGFYYAVLHKHLG